jgi:hypothetical protein
MPKVLRIGALDGRNNVFLYHETLLKRTVACEILTYDLARIDLGSVLRVSGFRAGLAWSSSLLLSKRSLKVP